MGYIIQYDAIGKIPKRVRDRGRRRGVAAIVLLTVIVCSCALGLRYGWETAIIPGNSEITKNAVTQLLQNVEAGMQINQAFAAFCSQIVEGDTCTDLA